MYTNDVQNQYAAFMQRRTQMETLLGSSKEIVAKLDMKQYEINLEQMEKKIHDDNFKVMVVGTFKNGKSTFINSLLGEEVLPAYSIPTTAIINEVKYGEEKRAILHFRNPLPETLPQQLAKKAREHIDANKDKECIPPLPIDYNEINNYVVIPMGMDASEMILESPYEKVELFWPLEILKNGVEIIDSPGLNENATRTKVTMEYLTKADAILMVMNASTLCSATEMNFIEYDLSGQGFIDPFFVVNRFDCIPPKERDMVKQFAKMKLTEFTSFGEDGIYFVSALDALEGKAKKDLDKYEGSGMFEFEKALSVFLVQNRGKAKLAQPARELKRVLNEEALYKVIPLKRKLLGSSLDEVEKKRASVQPQLNDSKIRKEQVSSKLALRIEQSKQDFRRAANRNVLELIDKIPVWVNDFTPTTKLGLNPLRIKTNLGKIMQEITCHIQDQIQIDQAKWRNDVLIPLAEEKVVNIFDQVEKDVEAILETVDNIQVELTGEDPKIEKAPTWQRILGTVGGLLMFDPCMAFVGGVSGFGKAMAKTVAIEVGLGFVMGLLGIMNPFAMLAALLAVFAYNVHDAESSTVKKAKEAVIKKVQQEIGDNREESVNTIVDSVESRFKELADQIVKGIENEINAKKDQLDCIIAELKKGQQEVKKKEELLKDYEKKIQELSIQLDEMIFQLVNN